MVLRNHVEWAIHCCAVLIGLPVGKYLATKDLAEFHGIPKEYLSKALQALSRAGIIENALGPTGGYRLARAPEQITFLDIVEAVEGPEPFFHCSEIRKNNPCRPRGHKFTSKCGIARIMHKADDAYRDSLRATSLADLAAMLVDEVPADILRNSRTWVEDRL